MLTLNHKIEILKNFSLKHKALGKNQKESNFYFGDPWERDVNFLPTYPFFNATLSKTSYDKSGMITRSFQIDVSDKVKKDESNENHALSDVEQICFDFFNYIEQVSDTDGVGLILGEISELTDYTEGHDDDVSGYFFTIELKSHQEGTSCSLPIFDGNIFDKANYIYVGGSNTNPCTGNFLVEIKDQDGNVIETFNTSGQYVVEVLTQVRDTITANTTNIIDPII